MVINHSAVHLLIILTTPVAIAQLTTKQALLADECSVDILFILDASGSVSGEFTNMRDFVSHVASRLRVSATGHRVSLLEYSGPSLTWPRYPFGFVKDTADFVDFIGRLPFLQGTTATGSALKLALELLEERRKEVVTLVVLVTDGYSLDDVEEPAEEIRNLERTILFAAGVTEFINKQTLAEIAGDEGHLWTNPNVEDRAERSLHEYLTCIIRPEDIPTKAPINTTATSTTTTPTSTNSTSTASTTTTAATGCELDLIVVIDSSSSVVGLYRVYVDMAVKIIDQLNIGQQFTRVGMVQYSSLARTVSTFHLNKYQSEEDVGEAIRRAEFAGGMTNTSAGLETALNEFSTANGARPNGTLKIVVIFTDGFSQVDPSASAGRLREAGVTVYAVSAADWEGGYNRQEMVDIAGDSSRVYTAQTLPNLVTSLGNISNRCGR